MKPLIWFYGLILALLPTYLIRFKIFDIPTTFLEVMIGVFLLLVLVFKFNRESWVRVRKLGTVNWVVAAFVLASIISVLISPETNRALGYLKAFILEPILLFYASIVLFKKPEDYKKPLQFLFWSAVAISVFGFIQYWTHLGLPLKFWGYGEEVKRISSIFEHPNALALYLAPLFVFFLVLQTRGARLANNFWSAVGIGAMGLALILTYSRGAWLGVAAGLLVLALRKSGITLRKWGIVVVMVFLILSPVFYTRLKTTFSDGASVERMQLFNVAFNKIAEQPLLGNGLFGFRNTLENSDYIGGMVNYPHNIVLQFWLETGLLGLASFFLLIWLSLMNYKKNPTILGFAAALYLLVMITHGMVDGPYFKNDLSVLFWVMLGFLNFRNK